MLGILRRDTNPYLKLTEVRNFMYQKEKGIPSFCGRSLQYFMLPYSAQFMKRSGHSSYVWQIFERYLLHCFTGFIKYYIKFSKGMSNIVKDFNYSSHPCVTVLAKSHLVGFLESMASLTAKPKPWENFGSQQILAATLFEITLKGLTYNVFSLVRIYHSERV